MIKKARKKPVEIEFIQFTGSNKQELSEWSNKKVHTPFNPNFPTEKLFVQTLEGTMRVDLDDYVIKGIHGEFYAVKPDIFLKTYDIVNEGDDND